MELMSSLLLYALAVALPQALGFPDRRYPELKLNTSLLINQNVSPQKKILLNLMAPPLVNMATEIQSVFKDITCQNCMDCMERAIKAQRVKTHLLHTKPHLEELYYDVLNENHHMYKRRTNSTRPETKTKNRKGTKGMKASVTITKYIDENGKIYALKVKEYEKVKNQTDGKKHICKIYNIAQSLPCDTFGSDIVLEIPKKKVKRDKKTKHRQTTEKTKSLRTSYKKRDIDNSEMPENFMPSIEDMY